MSVAVEHLADVDSRAASPGRRSALLLILLCVAVAGAQWIIHQGAAFEREPWWVWILFPAFLFTTATVLLRASARATGNHRKVWLCFGLAFLVYGSGELIWAIYDVFGANPDPFPVPAYGFYFPFSLLMIAGFWQSAHRAPSMGVTVVQLANLGILFTSILIAYLFLFYDLMDAPVPPIVSATALAYCILNLSAFLFGLVIVSLRVSGRMRRVMLPVLVGFGIIAINDYHFTSVLLNASYIKTDPLNGLYMVSCALFIWAAIEWEHRLGGHAADVPSRDFEERAKRWETLLPPLAVAAVLAFLFSYQDRMTQDLLPYIAGASVFFVAALALRSWWGHQVEMQLRMQALASEERLQSANRELRNEMERRARVQEELRQSQKLEALGHLTGGVAHDFNNLLAVILGNLEMASRPDEDESNRREFLAEAVDAANRGASLTQQLLTLSRKQALRPEPIDMPALLAGMRILLERTLGERIRVEIGECEGGLRCVADRAQLESVLLNLAINARDAMPEGGTLAIEAASAMLDEAQAAERPDAERSPYTVISVRDTGVGIPADMLGKVFDPFFTTKAVGAGTGLGLSMAYGFAKQSGGYVSIDSEVGEGTEVRLYLPATQEAAREANDEASGEMPVARGESVLVVEDEAAVRKLVVTFLQKLGYRVTAVADGEKALAVLEGAEPCDLLLSDVVLPGELSGPRLVREAEQRWPELRVLLMSGYAQGVLLAEAPSWPRDRLIQKPFRKLELARKIRALLDR
ncbi:MAG TPA: ATP-binding protein [Myxococcota bacterium]